MLEVTITTAIKVTNDTLKPLKAKIEKKYGKAVSYQLAVDPTVLGGMKITIGSYQWDSTVKHKLTVVKQKLLNI